MAVAPGDWLLRNLQSKGGKPNEYSDLVFGQVTSTSPLKIQYSDTMVLTDDLVTLGRRVTKHKEKIDGKDAEVDGSLKTGDGVAMIRRDGGQSFYVLDKVAEGDDA